MKKNKKTGFTLVELLVVIAIIALLLSVLIPSMSRAKEIAKRVVCGNGLKGIGAAMGLYADAYDNLMPADRAVRCITGTLAVEGHPYAVYREDYRTCDISVDPLGKLIPLRWACLFEKKYISDAKIFYCPSNLSRGYRYDSYIDPPPWGTLPQKYNANSGSNQWVRIGYTYFPTDSSTKLLYEGDTRFNLCYREPSCTRFDKLDRSLPYAADLVWSRNSLSHKTGIRQEGTQITVLNPVINALFKDGHVVYCGERDIFNGTNMSILWQGHEDRTYDDPGEYAFHYTILKMVTGRRMDK